MRPDTLISLLVVAALGPFLSLGVARSQSANWAATGYATYYTAQSCKKEGNSGVWTASGERFDEQALTCALPWRGFGGIYRVRSLKTGRAALVRHNDFGPGRRLRSRGVIIDLTPAAFSALGHPLSEGRIPVRVEVVE